MEELDFTSSTGKAYTVKLPQPCVGLRSAFVFSFHKSGSTLVNNMLARYCASIDVPTFSLFDRAFEQGVNTPEIQVDATACFKKEGYIYTGFRHFPAFELDLDGVPTVLIARDPRDMLVSLYYSIKTSHIIPDGIGQLKRQREEANVIDINDFVLGRSEMFSRAFLKYRTKLSKSDLTIYRYEDVVYKKREWLGQLVEKLQLKRVPKQITAVAKKEDIFPVKEDESQHIRQVHPGNFRSKLTGNTIEQLNDTLEEFLVYFGYEV